MCYTSLYLDDVGSDGEAKATGGGGQMGEIERSRDDRWKELRNMNHLRIKLVDSRLHCACLGIE